MTTLSLSCSVNSEKNRNSTLIHTIKPMGEGCETHTPRPVWVRSDSAAVRPQNRKVCSKCVVSSSSFIS